MDTTTETVFDVGSLLVAFTPPTDALIAHADELRNVTARLADELGYTDLATEVRALLIGAACCEGGRHAPVLNRTVHDKTIVHAIVHVYYEALCKATSAARALHVEAARAQAQAVDTFAAVATWADTAALWRIMYQAKSDWFAADMTFRHTAYTYTAMRKECEQWQRNVRMCREATYKARSVAAVGAEAYATHLAYHVAKLALARAELRTCTAAHTAAQQVHQQAEQALSDANSALRAACETGHSPV